jgi:hypothetical protein
MENINQINSEDNKLSKIENDQNNINAKTSYNNQEDSNKSEKTKDNYKSNNVINIPSNNYNYKPNHSQTSFPLLFK